MISLKSKVTQKVLSYFFLNPENSLYVNELARKLKLDKRNLVKKLTELEKEGILKIQSRGNLKLYSINKSYSFYNEYRKIVIKTIGFEERLRITLSEEEGVEEAYIYGSYAKNNMDVYSDIDLLIVGNHKVISLQKKLSKLQKEIDREINSVNMGIKDFKKRIKDRDPFIQGILSSKCIKIV